MKFVILSLLLFALFEWVHAYDIKPSPTLEFEASTDESFAWKGIQGSKYIANTLAAVGLKPLFANQADTWFFAPFISNGLFSKLASYQPNFPKFVNISNGSIDIPTLYKQLKNQGAITRSGNGYILHYPIRISPSARLNINRSLKLNTISGAIIVNEGVLTINNSRVSSWNVYKNIVSSHVSKFRPFIHNWNSANIHIKNSTLSYLGYNANLSHGLSFSNKQAAPAVITIQNSNLSSMYRGITAEWCSISMNDSSVTQTYRGSINATRCHVKLENSEFSQSELESHIILERPRTVLISGNKITQSKKSGVDIQNTDNQAIHISRNVILNNGKGLTIKESSFSFPNPLHIIKNYIANNHNAIDIERSDGLVLSDNVIQTNVNAITIENDFKTLKPSLFLVKNNLINNEKSSLKFNEPTSVYFENNEIKSLFKSHDYLSGSFKTLEAQMLRVNIEESTFVIK